MKRATLYGLLCVAVGLSSCKKNELPRHEEETDPVFYVKCDVNGVPLRIDAGLNDYYMTASHYQDANNIYIYKGELKQKNCSGSCGYKLTFLINDYKFSAPNAAMRADSALKAGDYAFISGNTNPLFYTGTFSPLTMAAGAQYTWDFSDAVSLSGQPVSRLFKTGETYTTKFTYDDPNGCFAMFTHDFKAGNPLLGNIRISGGQGQYNFSSDAPAGYSYSWDFGDNSTPSHEPMPTHTYATQGVYTVKLLLTDANNNTGTSYYQINTSNGCEANFNAVFTPVPNTGALSAITVLVTDPSGVTYSSADLNQPSGSQFQILSVEEYKTNESNEPTKKLKLRFNCSLTSSNGPVTISNGEAIIAVSYK